MNFNLKNDVIFKAFFSRKGNEKYLKEFLEALLNIRINKIIIKDEVSLEKLFKEEKGGKLDLLAELNDGISVDIEMQVEEEKDFMQRTSLYASKIASREIGSGLRYDEIKQVILINILNFEVFETEEYVSETAIVLEKHREYEVIKTPRWYFIELPKFRKIKADINNPLNQWLLFIDDHDKRRIKMAENRNKTLKEARTAMTYLTGDEEIRRLVELREKWAMDRYFDLKYAKEEGEAKGKKEGKKEGKTESKKEIAKEMLKNGIDIKIIVKCTGLSEEEIEKI